MTYVTYKLREVEGIYLRNKRRVPLCRASDCECQNFRLLIAMAAPKRSFSIKVEVTTCHELRDEIKKAIFAEVLTANPHLHMRYAYNGASQDGENGHVV